MIVIYLVYIIYVIDILSREEIKSSAMSSAQLTISSPSKLCLSSLKEFFAVSVSLVTELLSEASAKHCSLYPVPSRVIKENSDILALPMKNIVNQSFSEGAFPSSFKKGVIRPSTKTTSLNKEQYCHYRPITDVMFLSKLLEKFACVQIVNYLRGNCLLPKFQSAYREFFSTETAMIRVINDIRKLRAIDSRSEAVLLDLSSAFDTLHHQILL